MLPGADVMRWTKEQDQILIDCVEAGLAAERASGILKTKSRSAVLGRAWRLNISFKCSKENRKPRRARPSISLARKASLKVLTEPPHGFSDTLDPITDEATPRGPQCRFIRNDDPHNPDYCPNKKQLGSYCADHYLLTSADKDAAKKAIARLK